MAEITNYIKHDATRRTETAATTQQLTDWTITWENLTGAGFANADEVIILFNCRIGNDTASTQTTLDISIGSSFPGTTQAIAIHDPATTNDAEYQTDVFWVKKVTLSTNDDIYWGLHTETVTTTTAQADDFGILILKLADLDSDDYRYAEILTDDDNITSGDGDVDGSSVTLPASGQADDWGVFSCLHYNTDSAGLNSRIEHELSLGGTVSMTALNGSDTAGHSMVQGAVGYLGGAADSAVCKIIYSSPDASGTTDITETTIFALRLEAFVDHGSGYNSTPVGLNNSTFTQVADIASGSFSLTSTGNVALIYQGLTDPPNKYRNTQIQMTHDGTEFVTGLGNSWVAIPWNSGTVNPRISGIVTKSLTSGTIDIEIDGKCDDSTLNMDESTAVAFSLELAAAAGDAPLVLYTSPGLSVTNP